MYKEILIYAVVAASSLFLMTFVAHMMVGGLVAPETEVKITIGLCAGVACVIGAMAWDVARRRRRKRDPAQDPARE
jgi:membrane protein implicated in regulation of membrane protease activity